VILEPIMVIKAIAKMVLSEVVVKAREERRLWEDEGAGAGKGSSLKLEKECLLILGRWIMLVLSRL
jgi:hypothetical protein